jgi:hypothetical protein
MARTLAERIKDSVGTGTEPPELLSIDSIVTAITGTAGTATAGGIVVLGASKEIATITTATITNLTTTTLTLGAVAVTATGTEINTLAGVTAGTAAASKAVVLDANKGITGFRSTSAVNPTTQAAAGTLNSTGTLTAALMLGGIVTSTTAAGVTATLDTGTALDTAYLALFAGGAANDYFEFSIVNTGPNSITVATAGGWTDGGNAFVAVATGTSARFGCRRTGSNAWTIFKVA